MPNFSLPEVLLSNKLITPSLWTAALSRSFIWSFISFKDKLLPPVPPYVILITDERTASIYAASWRSCSVVILEHKEWDCFNSIASFKNKSFLSGVLGSKMKFIPPVISFAIVSGEPPIKPLKSNPCSKSLQTCNFSWNFGYAILAMFISPYLDWSRFVYSFIAAFKADAIPT